MNKVELTLDAYEGLKQQIADAKAETTKKVELIVKNDAAYTEQKAKLEKELYEVNADKRVLKITKNVPSVVKDFRIDLSGILDVVRDYQRHGSSGYGLSSGFAPSNYFRSPLEQQIRRYVMPTYVLPIEEDEQKEFINFDDVKKDYEASLDKKNAAELSELRVIRDSLQQTIEDNIAKSTKFRSDLEEKKQQEIIETKKQYDRLTEERQKTIDKLIQDYKDLKEDRDTRKLEKKLQDRIDELEAQLAKKGKFFTSWW